MQHTPVGIDLAKASVQLSVADSTGHIVERRRLNRARFHQWITTTTPRSLIMEACATSNYWGRVATEAGHEVILLHARYVSPYVRRNKTDSADADALLEAARNPELLPVPVKSEEQQALQTLHRIRSQWVKSRTARINEARAVLLEFGVVIPRGRGGLVASFREATERVPPLLQATLLRLIDEIAALHERVEKVDNELKAIARQDETCRRLMSVPGIGVLSATALACGVPDIQRFRSGRRFASWLGLTAREYSSGQSRRLGSISRRGDIYLRTLLIHGARSALLAARRLSRNGKPLSPTQQWVLALEQRSHHNKATVALANKSARAIWALWSRQETYDDTVHAAAA